jgi:NhaP-type Na+/H+ or K+/H+ antiporter
VSDARETDPLPEVGRHVASGSERLLANAWAILQTSVAASLAYFFAAFVLGNEQPFFAPVAAVVTLGLAPGERGRPVLSGVARARQESGRQAGGQGRGGHIQPLKPDL